MFKSSLIYTFLLIFLVFSFLVIVPLYLILYQDSDKMIHNIEKIEPLTPEQKAMHDKFKDDVTDSFISLAAYTFVLAFIVSLFFSRKFLMPVRELYKGTREIKEGNLDIRLDVKSEDELGEVTKAFNEMIDTLKKKTHELTMKNIYVNTMLDPLWVVDMDNIIIDVNPAFTRLFGYEGEEVIGVSIFDFLDDENEKIMREQLRKRDEGLSSTYGISIISKKEGDIPVLISGAPIIENGEIIAKLGIIKDFRAEIALRDALKEEKDHSEAIMDSLVDLLLVIDKDLRIIKANRAAENMAGKDITGQFCHKVLHKLEESCFMLIGMECPVKTVFETGRSYKTVHEHIGADGRMVFHEVMAYPVKSSEGKVIHVVEILKDITERKGFEDEIAQRNKELATLWSISRVLSHSLKAEDIFNSVLERVIDMLSMDGGGIFFLDDAGRELICRYQKGVSEDFMKSAGRMKVGEDIPGRVAVTGQSIFAPDLLTDVRIEKSILKHSGIRGLAVIPIKGKERLLGVFYIFSLSPHIFTPDEERVLLSIGEMTGIAFENIRLYEKMRELYEFQRKRRSEEQKNLLRLSSLLTSTPDIEDMLNSVILSIKDTAKADFVWFLEIDHAGNLYLRTSSMEGYKKGEVIYSNELSSIERYASEKKKPVVFSELTSESRFYISEDLTGYNTACAIPVYVGDKTLGAFTLYFRGLSGAAEEDIYFFQTIGSILAVAMERTRLYEETILEKGMADIILESITDGIMTVDNYGKVISMNKAVKEMIEIPLEPVGVSCCDIFRYAPENIGLRWTFGECLDAALSGRTSRRDAELTTKTGKIIPIKISSSPVMNNEGMVSGVVYHIRDVSKEKEIDRIKIEFVRAVSHEFRTPLSAIMGMTEMLRDKEVTGDRENSYLDTILSESKRLSDMVSDLLDVARIEAGKEVFKETDINFRAIIKDIESMLSSTIKKKEIRFSSAVEDVRGYKGDADKLKQLIGNLLDNSLTYSDGGSSVDITVRSDAEIVEIVVKDSGWGIEEEDLTHVGEKFYRGRYAGKAKGTGLGLSLCKEIAHMHKGELHIESTLGEGTTITVKLPFRRQE